MLVMHSRNSERRSDWSAVLLWLLDMQMCSCTTVNGVPFSFKVGGNEKYEV
jgi:hypothetical protein